MIRKLFNNLILLIIYIFLVLSLFFNVAYSLSEVKIIKKINNEIITNIDIEIEYNYLVALNKDLKNISKEEALKISESSLIREKIKTNELKKFFNLQKYENDDLINSIFKNFYQKLNFQNENDFKNYLSTYELTIDEVKEKIKLEILWNQLIVQKFQNQIKVNIDSLKNEIKENQLNYSDIIEYDLSEIVFQATNQSELEAKINEIKMNIDTIGFRTTANKFSISESSKLGGVIGKIKENQLSKQIKEELSKLNIGEITNPINIGNSFIIIMINGKTKSVFEQDENKVLEEMIEFEKNKQLDQYSQIYFNKIKLNTQIKSE